MEELVTNGMKVPLEKDALFAHDTMCEDLRRFLGRNDPDDQSPRGVAERAQKISFRRYVEVNELYLGELEGYKWDVKADVELPVKDIINCMTRAPDGKMATTGKLMVLDFRDVVCFDGNGKKENVLEKKGMDPYPAVCRDDSVIVAWVKHEEGLIKSNSSPNLECPICLTLFNQPKSLTCSHIFCKDCLERISQTQTSQQAITCPVCRKETPLPSGDVGKLQTNVPLSSLVDEVKTKSPTCTACKMDENPPAVSYCQDCGKYMCKLCDSKHSGWTPFSTHTVVAMSEMVSGKVPLKRRRKCTKHPNDDEECFCTDCREYVCHKCVVLKHLQGGHQIEEAAIHEEKLMENIKELQERTKSKKTTIENHIDFIETQRNEITNMMRNLNDDIDKTYEEYIQLLSARRETLKCQVKQLSEKFEKEFQVMEEESRQTIHQMYAMEELVTNGVKVPLEKDALFAHDTLCENLKSFLGRDDPDDQSPRGVAKRAQKISFCRHVKVNELYLGELEGYTWDVKAKVELPNGDSMQSITLSPGGKVAVGSSNGGIHLYSPDGELQQAVLKDVCICQFEFLSDGRCVVCDTDNEMSLYTPQWEKLEVTFEMMIEDEGVLGGFTVDRDEDEGVLGGLAVDSDEDEGVLGGLAVDSDEDEVVLGGLAVDSDEDEEPVLGGFTVDRDDNIYVSYRETKKIEVFTPQGGKAVREIMCDGYTPIQLFSFHTTGKLILNDGSTVVCLDGKGKKEDVLMKEGMCAWPAVCRDDSVIVAWVKHEEGLVSIDRYTRDLEHVHNLITDFKIQEPEARNWYHLQEFESGEIAFCTPDRLYIFDAIL
ncbi:uncharacterized protein [Diadema antillarum]|uniref:uncharacterized protein n=1 Tax=Diadema antillarum TaxID=105358 RepID=UPI003A8A983D